MYAPKGINIKIVQAFLHNNSYLKKVGSFTNSLMIKGKLRHPKVKSYGFKSAYKAHDYIENSKKIGKSTILIGN